jgi:hypothetical protein
MILIIKLSTLIHLLPILNKGLRIYIIKKQIENGNHS